MNQELTAQLAAAVVTAYRSMTDAPSPGGRRLFEAINEAWAYSAHGFPPSLHAQTPAVASERKDARS